MQSPRRQIIAQLAVASTCWPLLARPALAQSNHRAPLYPPVTPHYRLAFPRDHGAHPDYRTEWWYLTAWLETPQGPAGFQLTFFRSRTTHGRQNPSRLAARQLLFAHAALAMPANGKLIHEQIAARALPGMVSNEDTALEMGSAARPWRMHRDRNDQYQIILDCRAFAVKASLTAPGPPVLQGMNGFSRKGPQPQQASHYYSRPHLSLTGQLSMPDQQPMPVTGTGWLDHEWSSELLAEQASGWDWVGLHLNNGDALMAFRIRGNDGRPIWSHARWIKNNQPHNAPDPVFTPQRHWRSARTDTNYPVQMNLQVGNLVIQLDPLLDDQELDSRQSTGILYWEGAVRALDPSGKQIGLGYLELTGYAGKVRL